MKIFGFDLSDFSMLLTKTYQIRTNFKNKKKKKNQLSFQMPEGMLAKSLNPAAVFFWIFS